MKRKKFYFFIIAGLLILALFLVLKSGFFSNPSPKKAIQNKIFNAHNKILLIGIDAFDWKILNQLMEKDRLPTFLKLQEGGASGTLKSQKPILSPLIWTTLATGRPPDEHGILDFFYFDADTNTVLPASSRQRRVKAFWNIFSDFGRSSAIIGWFATWPAEPIKGQMISDQLSYYLFRKSLPSGSNENLKLHPKGLIKKIGPLIITPDEISYDEISRFVHIGEERYKALWNKEQNNLNQHNYQRDPINQLREALAGTKTYHNIALQMLRDHQPDLLAVYYEGIDTVSHLFMNYSPPRLSYISQVDYEQYKDAVFEFYRYMDNLVEELLGSVSRDTIVMIISDHGFFSGGERPKSNPADFYGKGALWHDENGVIILNGKNIDRKAIEGATILDITPTILYLSGLPVSSEMKGRPLLSAISENFKKTYPLQSIKTYEEVNPISSQKLPKIHFSSNDREELRRKLMALGYISQGATDNSESTRLTNVNNLGLVYFGRKDYEKAEGEFQKALNIRPDFIDALHNLSLVYLEQGKNRPALEAATMMFSSSMSISEDDYGFWIQIADKVRDWGLAENLLLKQVDEHPNKIETLIALGRLNQHLKEESKALMYYQKALSIDPKAEIPLSQMLDYLLSKGGEKEAERLLDKAIEQNPRSVFLHTKLGTLYLQEQRFASAQREFERAVELGSDQFEPLFYLGVCYGSQGEIEKAITSFEKVLSFYPDNFDVLLNLGASYAKLGKLDRALSLFENAYKIGPKSPELLNSMGALYMQIGQLQSAIRVFAESLQLFSKQKDRQLVESYLLQLKESPK
jgi:predicted AlkP superfamily phosphohydrolase/phosphomutase/Tfp pilus assembly protein PilF